MEDEDNLETTSFKDTAVFYSNLSNKIRSIVVGQDAAVEDTIKGLYRTNIKKKQNDEKVLASFFFFGPPGTGKTFLAKTIANELGYPCKVFEMGEFSNHEAEISLIGSDATYKNAQKGTLTKFVSKYQDEPHIIILDEIEKAHFNTTKIFLSILSDGQLEDIYTHKYVNFSNTILFFTSNVGKELYEDVNKNLSSIPLPTLLSTIKEEKNSDGNPKLSPELCSRIASGNVSIFNHLKPNALIKMINYCIDDSIETLNNKYNIKVKVDKKVSPLFIYHFGVTDGRILSSKASEFIENQLFELSKQEENVSLDSIEKINFKVDFDNTDNEIKNLFIKNKKLKIGIIAENKIINKFTDNKNYEIITIKNEEEINKSLTNNISAYFVDPLYGGIKQKTLSVTDYNSDGVNLFYTLEEKTDTPIYILDSKNNNLTNADHLSLLNDGARKIINYDDTKLFQEDIEDVLNDAYMESQSTYLNQIGSIIDYKTKQTISSDHKVVDITLYDFRKYKAYDSESSDMMIEDSEIPNTKFEDIIGLEDAKRELKYYITYLKKPMEFIAKGEKIPKGILLFGPPGTGKTMLGKAMAGEAHTNFMSYTAVDLFPTSKEPDKIKKVFAKARKYAPTIIFIDEIDAIGKIRKGEQTDSILTSLLTEMDGFKSSPKRPVFVLAATNYGVNNINQGISLLDPALVRRFDNKIYVGLPNSKNRIKHIENYLQRKNIKNIKKSTIQTLGECTVGESLATLDNILELANRNSIIDEKPLSDSSLLQALDQYNYGEIKEYNYNQTYTTAVHEAGHAYMMHLNNQTPAYITIESRSDYGGYVVNGDAIKPTLSKKDILNSINTALAGRIAEELLIGKEESLNTGVRQDLKQASDLAFSLLSEYGMNDNLVFLDKKDLLSSPLASQYLKKANEILLTQEQETRKLLKTKKKELKLIVSALMDKGHITKEELLNLLKTDKV